MNRKILTALAVLTVVIGLSVAGAVSAMDADATRSGSTPNDTDDGSPIIIKATTSDTTTATVTLKINTPKNDGNYPKIYNSDFWYYKVSSNYNPFVNDPEGQQKYEDGTNHTLVKAVDNTDGTFTITISNFGGNDLSTTPRNVNLGFELLTYEDKGDNKEAKNPSDYTEGNYNVIFAQHLYYQITTEYKAVIDDSKFVFNEFTDLNITEFGQKVDVDLSTKAQDGAENTVKPVEGSKWYATNLPQGLSMTTAGVISGMVVGQPAKLSDHNYTIKVSAVGPDGRNYYSSITATYNAGEAGTDATITATVTVNENIKALGNTDLSNIGTIGRYAVLSGDSVQGELKLSCTEDISSIEAYLVGQESSSETKIALEAGTTPSNKNEVNFKLPNVGAGEYFVEVTMGSVTEKVLSVLVVDKITSVKAGIAFDITPTTNKL